jgi:hypothetical protein
LLRAASARGPRRASITWRRHLSRWPAPASSSVSAPISQLRSDGIDPPFIDGVRAAILALASIWSRTLCWQVSGLYTSATARRVLAVLAVSVAMSVVGSVWLLLF